MNLKYYLRGLGLGIIITAVILGLTVGKRSQSMSDAQIIARAKELGMIENTVLSQYSETNKETKVPEKKAEIETEQPEASQPEIPAVPLQEEPQTEEEPQEEEELQEEEEPQTEEPQSAEAESVSQVGEEITFSILKGEDSHAVSQRLESAGIVSSAKEFDQFLIQNSYDKKISIGEYRIPADADFEAIANIITRQ